MSNLMNLIIPDETCASMSGECSYPKMHQDGLVYDYIYVHDIDINEATKKTVKENRPALVRYPHGAMRYPHGAPSDIIIEKVFS